jgi:hypothetical protein
MELRQERQAQMVIITKKEPPTGCQSRGGLTAFGGFSYDDKLNHLKLDAVKVGADWITLDAPIAGRAYYCGNAIPPEERPAAPPAIQVSIEEVRTGTSAPLGCKRVGETVGKDPAGSYVRAIEALRSSAVTSNANYVLLGSIQHPGGNEVIVPGQLLDCPITN